MILSAERWKKQEVPDFDGIVCDSGELYVFNETGLVRSAEAPAAVKWIDMGILAVKNLYIDNYRVVCGESSAHGSIGVVVLEDAESGAPCGLSYRARATPSIRLRSKQGMS